MAKTYYTYILLSEVVEKYYIGSTDDLYGRVKFHNGPRARWAKRYQPWQLVHSEAYKLRSEAVRRERYLKSLKGLGRLLGAIKSGRI
jgi:putative endonuclease